MRAPSCLIPERSEGPSSLCAFHSAKEFSRRVAVFTQGVGDKKLRLHRLSRHEPFYFQNCHHRLAAFMKGDCRATEEVLNEPRAGNFLLPPRN